MTFRLSRNQAFAGVVILTGALGGMTGCPDKGADADSSSETSGTTEGDPGSESTRTTGSSTSIGPTATSGSGSATTGGTGGLEVLCSQQTDQQSCESLSTEEQYRCYWLEIDVLAADCSLVSQTARCEYLPWVGDAVTLSGACGDFQNDAPGVAYREEGDVFETIEMYLYGADIGQVEGWNKCEYVDRDVHPICSCFCDSTGSTGADGTTTTASTGGAT